jgi:hypothetical protein
MLLGREDQGSEGWLNASNRSVTHRGPDEGCRWPGVALHSPIRSGHPGTARRAPRHSGPPAVFPYAFPYAFPYGNSESPHLLSETSDSRADICTYAPVRNCTPDSVAAARPTGSLVGL